MVEQNNMKNKYIRDIRTSYTKGQLKLQKALQDLGFAVDLEEPFHIYRIDCYVKEFHLGFEYDTKMTHSWKKKDIKRDLFLMENFKLPICRLLDGYTIKDITYFIDQWAESAKERKGNVY